LQKIESSEFVKSEAFKHTVLKDLSSLASKNKLSSLAKPRQALMMLEPFSIESGILTPTMKLKRNEAKKIFEREITELY